MPDQLILSPNYPTIWWLVLSDLKRFIQIVLKFKTCKTMCVNLCKSDKISRCILDYLLNWSKYVDLTKNYLYAQCNWMTSLFGDVISFTLLIALFILCLVWNKISFFTWFHGFFIWQNSKSERRRNNILFILILNVTSFRRGIQINATIFLCRDWCAKFATDKWPFYD